MYVCVKHLKILQLDLKSITKIAQWKEIKAAFECAILMLYAVSMLAVYP